jgi:hypothetical protein
MNRRALSGPHASLVQRSYCRAIRKVVPVLASGAHARLLKAEVQRSSLEP